MPSPKEPACVICGCTQNNACPGSCSWVRTGKAPLCSNPLCQVIDALDDELFWLNEAVLGLATGGKTRPAWTKKDALSRGRELVKMLKQQLRDERGVR